MVAVCYMRWKEEQLSPAVSLSSSPLDDSLHKDAKFLQSCISTNTHPDDADPKAVLICKHTDPIW